MVKTPQELWTELLAFTRQAAQYQFAANLLRWDMETYMPEGAGPGRDKAFSLMATMATKTFVDQHVGDLIEELLSRRDELTEIQQRVLDRTKEVYRRANAVPLELTREWNEITSAATRHWKEARAKSDFSMFLPWLEKVLKLLLERADALGYEEHPYNAVMVDFEPGMTVTETQRILLPLREPLVGLVAKLKDREQPGTTCLVGDFPEDKQLEFSRAILRRVGFDFNTGRIDGITGHPMTLWCGPDDTRCTTRFSRTEFGDGLFASIHEGGHGIYQQGADPLFNDLSTDQGFVSMAIHESQSRMYENILGRGMPFWQFFFPQLQAFFSSFDRVSLDAFWRAINVVTPSLIRIHADEVTYPLHILLRFELELAMLSGDLQPADLPGAWNDKMEEYLGIRPANDAEGCLQDVHWSQGYYGYFPSYALGGLMTAQLWEAACQAIPNLAERISRGNFSDFLNWLRTNVHELGYAYSLPELVQKVTGKPLDPQVWLTYIFDKCGDVYRS